ncbi:glycerophosphodiester phosphodiesterase [Actinomadura barringtoniae]|uniref:Glycerophosphodiester phosphodiesterase n=1 Tax=Actinomadura barringtoniae TaxID=1427535 RepID=A0A939PLF0_9ACTN|nr:glycerophosphodiester phosphodiesterase [Actinomadura barringtoniae]MBO2455112.1 glycerophosphodiester phosphodiesterase [Actinomadura barringtoniae]
MDQRPHPAVSAHRRDEAGVAGLRAAVGSGAEYVEIDIRRTGDGKLVVHHDPGIGGLRIARASYEQVQDTAGERPVPLVADAMKIMAAGRVRGHLDLKEPGCELEATELAMDAFGEDGFVVTTKDVASITQVKKTYPQVKAALSVGRSFWEPGVVRDMLPVRLIRASGADMVALNFRLARVGVLAQCARAGFPAMIWTVNAEKMMRRFLNDPRVAVLITDHPEQALALRDGRP